MNDTKNVSKNDKKIRTSMCSTVYTELLDVHSGGSSSFNRYEWVRYVGSILSRLMSREINHENGQ